MRLQKPCLADGTRDALSCSKVAHGGDPNGAKETQAEAGILKTALELVRLRAMVELERWQCPGSQRHEGQRCNLQSGIP